MAAAALWVADDAVDNKDSFIYTDAMVSRLRIGLALLVTSIATAAVAQSPAVFIVPDRIEQSMQVDAINSRSQSNSSTIIEGNGQTLAINYSSDSDLQIFLFYLNSDNSYDPADTVIFPLPMGENVQANVDLTHSGGWHPGTRNYKLTLISDKKEPNVSFASTEFLPATLLTRIAIPFVQLSFAEVFTPSSYHALHGYNIFGQSFATLLGLFAILLTIIFCVVRRTQGVTIGLAILIGAQLMYGLRWSLDEIRITTEHIKSWYGDYLYDEAQSTYELANLIKKVSHQKPAIIFVCRDGTDFKEKLLRYFSYPATVSSAEAAAATHFVAMNTAQWSYNEDTHIFVCKGKSYTATHRQTLKDGTQFFSSDTSPHP